MANWKIQIEGLDELMKKLNDLPEDLDKSQALVNGFVAAERMIKANIQSEATFGRVTGTLHAALATYGELLPKRKYRPGGFVKIQQRPGIRGSAPHGHLVEAGTRARWRGRSGAGGRTGIMPANPFFKRAVLKSRSLVASCLAQGLKDFLKEHTK